VRTITARGLGLLPGRPPNAFTQITHTARTVVKNRLRPRRPKGANPEADTMRTEKKRAAKLMPERYTVQKKSTKKTKSSAERRKTEQPTMVTKEPPGRKKQIPRKKRSGPKPEDHLQYVIHSPDLRASLARVFPIWGLPSIKTQDETWHMTGNLTIRLTDTAVYLCADKPDTVTLALLSLIAARDPLLPEPENESPIPRNEEGITRLLNYLTNCLGIPKMAAIVFLAVVPQWSDNPDAGVNVTDLAAQLPQPADLTWVRTDCRTLYEEGLIRLTDDQIYLTPAGTRVARTLIDRWFRGA